MTEFTYEERFLIEAYGSDSRTDTIHGLQAMQKHLDADEVELREMTDSLVHKLTHMSGADYSDALSNDDGWSPFALTDE